MQNKKDTKSKIMMAAIQLFPELGYEKASMRLIAETVGITKPALYYHFKNKDELFRSIVDYGNQFSIKKLQEIRDESESIEKKLADLVWIKFSIMHQNEAVKKFSGWLVTDGMKYLLKIDMEQQIRLQQSIIYDIFEKAIEKGELRKDIDLECFTYLLLGAANVYARRQYIFNENIINNEKIGSLVQTLLRDARTN